MIMRQVAGTVAENARLTLEHFTRTQPDKPRKDQDFFETEPTFLHPVANVSGSVVLLSTIRNRKIR